MQSSVIKVLQLYLYVLDSKYAVNLNLSYALTFNL